MPHLSPPPVLLVRRGPEAERRLFHAYHDAGDPRARDALTARFMPLARSVARRYRGSTVPLAYSAHTSRNGASSVSCLGSAPAPIKFPGMRTPAACSSSTTATT